MQININNCIIKDDMIFTTEFNAYGSKKRTII